LNKQVLKDNPLAKGHLDEGLKGLGMKICAQILWAIENKDYHFFKDLARLCEHGPFGWNLRSWLISIHCRPSLDKQEHFFTARELCENVPLQSE
jgi:hypothetical protein